MDKEILERLEAVEKKVDALQKAAFGKQDIVEMDLILPEDDINGLHFNETKVHAVFEKKEDGWYHSRDILFLSARNTEDDNSRDILTEYLTKHESSGSIKSQIALAMKAGRVTHVTISLPKENEGIKKYNGVDWWYWLEPKSASFSSSFCYVTSHGNSHTTYASSVGGVAPAFRVA
jgi:hypothetical protein